MTLASQSIHLIAIHIPGVANREADALSRLAMDEGQHDWVREVIAIERVAGNVLKLDFSSTTYLALKVYDQAAQEASVHTRKVRCRITKEFMEFAVDHGMRSYQMPGALLAYIQHLADSGLTFRIVKITCQLLR